MIVGKVVGSVVSTRKSEKLIGQKFMIVEPVHHMKSELSQIVAIDIIGAGSVVTRSIPPDCIAVGNPCRVIRKLSD